jgi:hypothetical protein
LEKVLTPLGLQYIEADQQLIVQRPAAADLGQQPQAKFDVSDLVSGDASQLSWLAETIMTLIAPHSWYRSGGTGTIELQESSLLVRHEDAVLFEVLFFCEKLRLARGLATRSRYDRSLFDPVARMQAMQSMLDKQLTLTFLRETSFGEIIQEVERAAGARILIDWQSLASEGWNPQAAVTFRVHEEPLGTALKKLVSPLDLEYRVINDRIIEIATRDKLAETLTLECYPAADWLRKRANFSSALAEIQSALGDDQFQTAGGRAALAVDANSSVLLMLAAPAMHGRLLSLLYGR